MSTTVPVHELPDTVVAAVSGLVDDYLDCEEQVASLHARKAKLLSDALSIALEHANLAGLTWSADRDVPVRSMIAEFATAARVHNRTMSRYVSDAYALVEHFPQTWEALRAGTITDKHAAVIVEHGTRLTEPSDRARYEAQVLPVGESETPSGLAARARITAERVNPISLQDRHDTAAAGRCVYVNDLDDGMSELRAILTSVEAHGIYHRLSTQAHLIKTHRDHTTTATDANTAPDATSDPEAPRNASTIRGTVVGIDQIRANILTDMLLTADPNHVAEGVGLAPSTLGEIHANVHVTVPVLTLTHTGTDAGAGVDPAMLDGRVPIDPETARRLTGAASGWDRVLTHPITGAVLTVDRYTPNTDLKRFLTARDQHCRFPGCRTRHTDIDHTPNPGPTAEPPPPGTSRYYADDTSPRPLRGSLTRSTEPPVAWAQS